MMQPMMNKGDVRIIEKTLKQLSEKKDPLRLLEWGSGGSTIYFTRFLEKYDIPYTWVSLEYNREWYERIKNTLTENKNIELHLFDSGNTRLKQLDDVMDEYVSFPRSLGEDFDFILVDGRKRRRCLLEAQKMLAPGGFVFLHDAQRRYYHSAFRTYPDRAFMSMFLWRGSNSRGKLQNVFRTLFWRILYFTTMGPYHFVKRALLPLRKKLAKARAKNSNLG